MGPGRASYGAGPTLVIRGRRLGIVVRIAQRYAMVVPGLRSHNQDRASGQIRPWPTRNCVGKMGGGSITTIRGDGDPNVPGFETGTSTNHHHQQRCCNESGVIPCCQRHIGAEIPVALPLRSGSWRGGYFSSHTLRQTSVTAKFGSSSP